jgi:adenosylcobinamide-phosphate synthase
VIHFAWLYPLALLFDTALGDPRSGLHPVALIGGLIAELEKKLLVLGDSAIRKKINGFLLVLAVLSVSYGAVWWIVLWLELYLPPAVVMALEALMLSFTISPRSLTQAGMDIRASLLSGDMTEARRQVGYIVGRDTHNLNEREITRATVETMAENIVDGIISPLFFAWVGGVPLAFLYRAVNTMDSMIGYRNERYRDFGMPAARTDDVFNYVPARITGLLIIAAAFLLRLDAVGAAKSIWHDASKHPSPNSGISEAGVAGALGIQLGGLNYYGGIPSQRATMGISRYELKAEHIRQTSAMVYLVTLLFSLIVTGLGLLGFQRMWVV